MTDETPTEPTAPDVPAEPAIAAAPAAPATDEVEAPSGRGGARRREAGGYRHKLRDTEQERDAALQRLERHDRSEAEQLAGELMLAPSDMWLVGELGDVRGDDGAVDAERVQALVERALEGREHWRKPAPPPADFDAGFRAPPPSKPSFGAALADAATGR